MIGRQEDLYVALYTFLDGRVIVEEMERSEIMFQGVRMFTFARSATKA